MSESLEDFNFIEVSKKLPSRYRHFVFIDTKTCAAKKIFDRYHLPVKVKETWSKDIGSYSKYHITVCDVPKKYALKFIEAMHILKDNVLILGYSDYEESCEKIFGDIFENI